MVGRFVFGYRPLLNPVSHFLDSSGRWVVALVGRSFEKNQPTAIPIQLLNSFLIVSTNLKRGREIFSLFTRELHERNAMTRRPLNTVRRACTAQHAATTPDSEGIGWDAMMMGTWVTCGTGRSPSCPESQAGAVPADPCSCCCRPLRLPQEEQYTEAAGSQWPAGHRRLRLPALVAVAARTTLLHEK